MGRRPCQFCAEPLGRFAKMLHIYTCKHCAYRMSMGTSPARPKPTSVEDEPGPWTEVQP